MFFNPSLTSLMGLARASVAFFLTVAFVLWLAYTALFKFSTSVINYSDIREYKRHTFALVYIKHLSLVLINDSFVPIRQ